MLCVETYSSEWPGARAQELSARVRLAVLDRTFFRAPARSETQNYKSGMIYTPRDKPLCANLLLYLLLYLDSPLTAPLLLVCRPYERAAGTSSYRTTHEFTPRQDLGEITLSSPFCRACARDSVPPLTRMAADVQGYRMPRDGSREASGAGVREAEEEEEAPRMRTPCQLPERSRGTGLGR